jgi:uncharacterized protein YgiB involved in biofilm formation
MPDAVTTGRLVRHALGGAALLALAGCDDSTKALRIYPNVEACRVDHSAADCDAAFAGAQTTYASTAPAYAGLESCEQIYGPGGCVARSDAVNSFIPLMTGFLIGQAMAGTTAIAYQPVYVDRQGIAYAGREAIGTYRQDCAGSNCPRGSGGYVYASGGGHGAIWHDGRYSVRSVSHSSGGAAVDTGTGIMRGGFGSSARGLGGIGG